MANERSIFLAALEFDDPKDRAACVANACANDEGLRQAVLELLRAYADAGEFLEDPAGELPEGVRSGPFSRGPATDGPELGTRIGPYRLLARLGEGGMGIVYQAEQDEPIRRQVALKIIKPGMDSAQVLARFDAERQALALMEHPNIARVLDAGATDAHGLPSVGLGRPYFVMELVVGVPITQFCDERKLSARQRLELYIPVCQAVQHAHQKGIIHRDIKPTNVLVTLVDGCPVPKVIDFGIAKALHQRLTESSVHTEIGLVIGTPEYMSPEQAELSSLDVDTRSDVYALGVLLYELLTGTTPFGHRRMKETPIMEVLRIIREEEPLAPSSKLGTLETVVEAAAQRDTQPGRLARELRGELDWIVLKALEKDRERRYESAGQLADDVARYLRNEPVLAGPPSTWYRWRKYLRRHRGAAIAASVIAATVFVGSISTTVGMFRAWNAEAKAKNDEATAKRALAAEARAQSRTRQALDTLTDDVVSELLGKQPVLSDNEKTLLRKTLRFYEDVAADAGDTPEAKAMLAEGWARCGKIHERLGEFERAVELFRKSIALWQELQADRSAVLGHRVNYAMAWNNMGVALRAKEDVREAREAYRQALNIWQRLYDDSVDPANLASKVALGHCNVAGLAWENGELAEADRHLTAGLRLLDGLLQSPSPPATAALQAGRGHLMRGQVYEELGRVAEVEEELERGRALLEQLVARFPEPLDHRDELANAHNALGNFYKLIGQGASARRHFDQAIELLTPLVAQFPSFPEYRVSLVRNQQNLATIMEQSGQYNQAVALSRQVLTQSRKLAAHYGGVPHFVRDLAKIEGDLAYVLQKLGEHDEALATFQEAIRLHDQIGTRTSDVTAHRRALAQLISRSANQWQKMGRRAEAEQAYREAIAIQEKLLETQPQAIRLRRDLASSYVGLATMFHDHAGSAKAEELYQKALRLRLELADGQASVPEFQAELSGTYNDYAIFVMRQGDWAKSADAFDKAIVIAKKLAETYPNVPAYHHKHGRTLVNLGLVHTQNNRGAEGVKAWREAEPILEKVAAGSPEMALYQRDLATLYTNLGGHVALWGNWVDGQPYLEKAIRIQEELIKQSPDYLELQVVLGGAYCNLGNNLARQNRIQDGLAWHDKAIPLLEGVLAKDANTPDARPFLANTYFGKASTLVAAGKHADVIPVWERAFTAEQTTRRWLFRAHQAVALARTGASNDAVKLVREIPEKLTTRESTWFDAARALALASAATDHDDKSRAALQDEAMRLLDRSQASGTFRSPTVLNRLKTDALLDSLRAREDFRKLLAAAEKQ